MAQLEVKLNTLVMTAIYMWLRKHEGFWRQGGAQRGIPKKLGNKRGRPSKSLKGMDGKFCSRTVLTAQEMADIPDMRGGQIAIRLGRHI